MLQRLTEWLKDLMRMADEEEDFIMSWFSDTKDEPFSIVGGWQEGFSKDYSDLLYISKTNSSYAMCVKIAINEGSYAYTDFELLNMPVNNETNEVDDTCLALERADDPAKLAQFLMTEWERLSKEY